MKNNQLYVKIICEIQKKKENAVRKPKTEKKAKKPKDPNAPKKEPNEFMKNSIDARKFVANMIEKGELKGIEAGFKLSGIITKFVKANYNISKDDKTDWTASFKKFKNEMKSDKVQKAFIKFYKEN